MGSTDHTPQLHSRDRKVKGRALTDRQGFYFSEQIGIAENRANSLRPQDKTVRTYLILVTSTVACMWFPEGLRFTLPFLFSKSEYHSIDRVDNNGEYSPENCIWVTDARQRRNKRTSVILTRPRDGKMMNIKEWARELGVTANTIHRRLRNGWSLDDALDPAKMNACMRS